MDPLETGNPETSEAGAAAPPDAPANGNGTWRDAVPAALRKVAEKFVTPADVVKSYAELERKLGGAVSMPGKDAGDDELDAFYGRLGRPARAGDYDIDVGDAVAAAIKADETASAQLDGFLDHAHQAGFTNTQAQAAIDWYLANAGEELVQRQQRKENEDATLEAELRREARIAESGTTRFFE